MNFLFIKMLIFQNFLHLDTRFSFYVPYQFRKKVISLFYSKYVLLGMNFNTPAYRIYEFINNKIILSCFVVFFKEIVPSKALNFTSYYKNEEMTNSVSFN